MWAQGEGGRVAESLVSGLLLLEDVHFWSEGFKDSIIQRLQWHSIVAVQLIHILGKRASELVKDAEWEKALKEVVIDTAWDKLAKGKLAEIEGRLGEAKLKLVTTESLNLVRDKEVAELKVALEACETKWYDKGFADAENSVVPVVLQARAQGFEEGWLVALKAVGIPGDSQLWNPKKIPCLAVALPVQSQAEAADDEDTPSMRALVEAIDTHVENPDTEATINLNAPSHAENRRPTTKDVAGQISDDIVQLFQTNSAV
nr:hypothetical protein CFP56_33125 [Quercus suber]